MSDIDRLVAKTDEAIKALKMQRRTGNPTGTKIAEKLREKFAAGQPFEMTVGHQTAIVRPQDVRIHKTRIDFGFTEIALTQVHGHVVHDCKDNKDIFGPGMTNDNGADFKIVVA